MQILCLEIAHTQLEIVVKSRKWRQARGSMSLSFTSCRVLEAGSFTPVFPQTAIRHILPGWMKVTGVEGGVSPRPGSGWLSPSTVKEMRAVSDGNGLGDGVEATREGQGSCST